MLPKRSLENGKATNNISLLKNIKGRIFGKDISNEINNLNKNCLINQQNKKAKNTKNEYLIKNKELNKENIRTNYNLLKYKNDENIQNKCPYEKQNKINFYKDSKIIRENYQENPIEEYDELLTKNLFIDELKNRPNYEELCNILSLKDKSNRVNCQGSLILLSEAFEFRQETIYLTINLFDRYLHQLKISNKLDNININTILITCIFIASKYEEIYPPFLEDYLDFIKFSKEDIFRFEYNILEYTKFELHICSPYLFLTKFYESTEKKGDKKIFDGAQFILDLCIISLEFCAYKPSFQAALCLYLSKKFLNNLFYKVKLWMADNEYKTGYSEDEIKKNMKIPLKIIKEYFSAKNLKDFIKSPLFKKYSKNKHSGVSIIFKNLFKH